MIEIKKAHELDIVELTEDLPECGVYRGAQGTVVEVFDKPEEAYMIEFLENSGTSSKIADWVKPEQIKNISIIAKEYYERGMYYLKSGKVLEAARELRQAISFIPSYIRSLHESLAQPLAKAEDWPNFIGAMQFIRLINPSYELAKHNLAIAYLNYGVQEANKSNYERAQPLFYAALAVESPPNISLLIRENIATSHIALGIKSHQKGDFQGAVKHFESAYIFNPNERIRHNLSLAYVTLARFYVGVSKLMEAIYYYQMAEDIGLIVPEILNNHGVALAKVGDEKKALLLFESALNLAPEDKTIRSNIMLAKSKSSQDFITEDIAIEFYPSPPMHVDELSITA
jgi:tetratricopeptide (TPR) repeat protein